MFKRTVTAGLLMIVLLGALFLGKTALSTLIFAVLMISGYEVYRMQKDQWPQLLLFVVLGLIGLTLCIDADRNLQFISLSLILLLSLSIFTTKFPLNDMSLVFVLVVILGQTMFAIQNILEYDLWVLGFVLVGTYATDTFAYLGGSLFGRRKLIERISPNKTIEGSIIGTIASVLLSVLYIKFLMGNQGIPFNMLYCAAVLIPLVSQIGDLTFSMIKRHYNIKDFSSLLPGHGGMLDRIDSVMFSLITFNALLTLFI